MRGLNFNRTELPGFLIENVEVTESGHIHISDLQVLRRLLPKGAQAAHLRALALPLDAAAQCSDAILYNESLISKTELQPLSLAPFAQLPGHHTLVLILNVQLFGAHGSVYRQGTRDLLFVVKVLPPAPPPACHGTPLQSALKLRRIKKRRSIFCDAVSQVAENKQLAGKPDPTPANALPNAASHPP